MALQISEGTLQISLDRLRQLANQPYPIGYVRIESFNLNYNDPSFTAVLAMYYDEQARNNDVLSCSYYMIGCTLQQADFDILQGIDDRQLLYKHIEYIINYQVLKAGMTESTKSQARDELIALKHQLGLETLFDLSDEV